MPEKGEGRPLLERLLEKVRVDSCGCWVWTAAKILGGYGLIREKGGRGSRMLLAHRASYEIHVGPIPPGVSLKHRCHNPGCVNPAHLALSTDLDARRARLQERMMAHARVDPDGCWTWVASTNYGGYGRITTAGRTRLAHRLMYELLVGQVPAGLQLDHLCRNRLCVNPAHLEPVTSRENSMRGVGVAAKNAAKTHCHKGHPFAGDNLIVTNNGNHKRRQCRECRMSRARPLAVKP